MIWKTIFKIPFFHLKTFEVISIRWFPITYLRIKLTTLWYTRTVFGITVCYIIDRHSSSADFGTSEISMTNYRPWIETGNKELLFRNWFINISVRWSWPYVDQNVKLSRSNLMLNYQTFFLHKFMQFEVNSLMKV